MRHALRSMALACGLVALASTPSRSQMMAPPVVYRQPYVTVAPRAYTYNQGVLPGFSPRGGIGTTPFLGNTRGLGAYSYNYDRPVARPYYSNQVYGRRMYRRYR